jgi:DMSO/TMAO reductase YedYZ molybdopterin-dependent catalytic subunit
MISRRAWLSLIAQAGVAGFAGRWMVPGDLFSQSPADLPVSEQLIRRALRPPDYETPVRLLDTFITPNESFFVRSHLPVPAALDASTWTLGIDGNVATPLSLSLDSIRALPPATVTVTLECAGNGRSFFEPSVAGVQWEKGAVGTARWTGVRLADLLGRAGVRPAVANVLMTPADRPLGTMPAYVRQLPNAKAMHRDTLIAYEMNGVPIPPLHGYPLRLIVPGWEGAYSVKWLTKLTAIDGDSDSFWVATAYRYPNRSLAPGEAGEARDLLPLAGLAVKSLVTRPAEGAVLAPGPITIGGFAWAGEADITGVEVSTDDGATWQAARLVGEQAPYAWRRFEHAFTPARPGVYAILSRATDSNGRTQPATAAWNPSGYLWNAYDKVSVTVAEGARVAAPANSAGTPSTAAAATPPDVYTACTACHGPDLIDQQRLTRVGWQREVEKMMRWGARVPEAEKDTLVDYLLSRTARR